MAEVQGYALPVPTISATAMAEAKAEVDLKAARTSIQTEVLPKERYEILLMRAIHCQDELRGLTLAICRYALRQVELRPTIKDAILVDFTSGEFNGIGDILTLTNVSDQNITNCFIEVNLIGSDSTSNFCLYSPSWESKKTLFYLIPPGLTVGNASLSGLTIANVNKIKVMCQSDQFKFGNDYMYTISERESDFFLACKNADIKLEITFSSAPLGSGYVFQIVYKGKGPVFDEANATLRFRKKDNKLVTWSDAADFIPPHLYADEHWGPGSPSRLTSKKGYPMLWIGAQNNDIRYFSNLADYEEWIVSLSLNYGKFKYIKKYTVNPF